MKNTQEEKLIDLGVFQHAGSFLATCLRALKFLLEELLSKQ